MRLGRRIVRAVLVTVGSFVVVNALCAYLVLGKVRDQSEEKEVA